MSNNKPQKRIFRVRHSMFGIRYSIVLLCLCSCALCQTQTYKDQYQNTKYATQDTDTLFSPSVAQKFYEIAYEMANEVIYSTSTKQPQNLKYYPPYDKKKQAIILLTATTNLDNRAKYVLADMIKIIAHPTPAPDITSDQDYSEPMYLLLANYIDNSADLEVARIAVSYLLDQLDSREQREKLLEDILNNFGNKNPALDSELATLLALLMAEKADRNTASSLFLQAYSNNKYNKLAFAKLAEIIGEQIESPVYLEHLRLTINENPLNLEAALTFAQYAERLQLYELAAESYKYSAELFNFLYPAQNLPAYIYLPWAISNYNTKRNLHKCLQIAKAVRQTGRSDLLLEAIAAKAAQKIGDNKKANQILKATEEKNISDFKSDIESRKSQIASQLAWFYCFAAPDPDKAIDWANKAYSTDPNSPTTAALLAYALVMNSQNDWANILIENYQKNQIANLTTAYIQLANNQTDAAVETLKSVIASDPASIEAEHARQILTKNNREYIPPIDPDITLTVLKSSLATQNTEIAPQFANPQNLISVQLNVRGGKFAYGTDLGGVVAITNSSTHPLIISDDALFTGRLRIDANIKGNISKKIPNLVSVKIRPSSPIKPGHSLLIPVKLLTAELRNILLTYPQASLDIELTAFIDPVVDEQGKITNRLNNIKPAKATITRPPVELTGKFLRNRFNSLIKGRQGQKIKTAQLFVGLLAEQQAMANKEPLYKFMYADWMPDLLKSALLHNLTDDDWVVKTHTMVAMIPLSLDYELTKTVAENLNDTHWPTRLIALYLLAKNQSDNFKKVLNWTAQYDSNNLVRDMALALGADKPETAQAENP